MAMLIAVTMDYHLMPAMDENDKDIVRDDDEDEVSIYDNDDEDTSDEVYVSNHQNNDRWSVRAEINNDIQLKL